MTGDAMTWREWIASFAPGLRVVVAPRNQEQAGTITRVSSVLIMVRLDETGEVRGFYRDGVFSEFIDGRKP